MKLTNFFGIFGSKSSSDPASWSSKQIDEWFEKGEWSSGWDVPPDVSVNRIEFAKSYFANTERWVKAFNFLKTTDLLNLELKRFDIDGDNIYAFVNEYITKNPENAEYEAHRKYIDIQYIIMGKELIGVAPYSLKSEVTQAYDINNDIEFMKVSGGSDITATPEKFFIFFPSDAHRPNLKFGENSQVRKIVVKVKVD